MNRDDCQFDDKVALRRHVLRALHEEGSQPIICEAFAGYGKLFSEVYREECLKHGAWGACIEQDQARVGFLAQQRDGSDKCKGWLVAAGTCEKLLAARFAAHIPFTLLDLDPYGSPWLATQAWLSSLPLRAVPQTSWIVATDGAGFNARLSASDKVLSSYCKKHGETYVRDNYPDIAREALETLAASAGVRVASWEFFQTPGKGRKRLAHWTARLER